MEGYRAALTLGDLVRRSVWAFPRCLEVSGVFPVRPAGGVTQDNVAAALLTGLARNKTLHFRRDGIALDRRLSRPLSALAAREILPGNQSQSFPHSRQIRYASAVRTLAGRVAQTGRRKCDGILASIPIPEDNGLGELRLRQMEDLVDHFVKLDNLPDGYEFPTQLRDKIQFDVEHHKLVFHGYMSKADFDRLSHATSDWKFRRTLEDLFRECTPEDKTPPSGVWRVMSAVTRMFSQG
jgi:hypothetical protein